MTSSSGERGQRALDLAVTLVGYPPDDARYSDAKNAFRDLFLEVLRRCTLRETAEVRRCIPSRLEDRQRHLRELAAAFLAISTELPEVAFVSEGCDRELAAGLRKEMADFMYRYHDKELGERLVLHPSLKFVDLTTKEASG